MGGFVGEPFHLPWYALDRFVLIELCRQLAHIDKKLIAKKKSACPKFDSKGYAQAHLNLKAKFSHVPQLEDF